MAGFGYGLPISRLVRKERVLCVCLIDKESIVCKVFWWRFKVDFDGRVIRLVG